MQTIEKYARALQAGTLSGAEKLLAIQVCAAYLMGRMQEEQA